MLTGGNIVRFRLITLRAALQLEIAGMHRRGRPAAAIIRELLGTKTRAKEKLLAEFEASLREAGILTGE
jgi:hypothetical protein